MTASFVLTYDNLVTTVEQYLERNDAAVVNQIPTFITLCEFEIAQQIKTLGQQQVVDLENRRKDERALYLGGQHEAKN